jgi:hypothetical protein
VASGFQKWGMTGATIAAELLRDRLTGRDNAYAGVFDPNRVAVRSAPKLAKMTASVARHLVADRLAPAQAASADDVPPGEARVVRAGLGKIRVTATTTGASTPSPCAARTSAVSCTSTRPSAVGIARATARGSAWTARCSPGPQCTRSRAARRPDRARVPG